MSEIEIITDGGRRRHCTAADTLRIVEETLDDGASISVVARRNGVAPNLLYRWRHLMLAGGNVAVSEDDDVTANKVARQLEDRSPELERQLGRKTLADRLAGRTKPHQRYHKAQDAALVPILTALVSERPSYGYRRITALINRKLRQDGVAPVSHKRLYRLLQIHKLQLTPAAAERADPVHDGKVIVMRSNLRWCVTVR